MTDDTVVDLKTARHLEETRLHPGPAVEDNLTYADLTDEEREFLVNVWHKLSPDYKAAMCHIAMRWKNGLGPHGAAATAAWVRARAAALQRRRTAREGVEDDDPAEDGDPGEP